MVESRREPISSRVACTRVFPTPRRPVRFRNGQVPLTRRGLSMGLVATRFWCGSHVRNLPSSQGLNMASSFRSKWLEWLVTLRLQDEQYLGGWSTEH